MRSLIASFDFVTSCCYEMVVSSPGWLQYIL
jgi:hypothetical protein